MTETEVMTGAKATTETNVTTSTGMMTGTNATTETKAMTSTTEAGASLVKVGENAKLGKILVDDKGMTLYIFDKDTKGKSNCAGGCVKNWPLLTVKDKNEKLTPGDGVSGKLEVIDRGDGSYQVAVNGMPLYYYAKDKAAGDVTGQAVGDVWWVVAPDGSKVTKQ